MEFGLCDRSTAGDRDGAQLLQQFDGRKRAARGRRRDGKPSTGIGGPSVDTFGLHFGVWNVRQRPRLCRLLSPPVSADHLQPVSPVPQFLNQKTIRGLLRDALSLFLSHFILHNANPPPPPHKLILLPKKEGDVGKEKKKAITSVRFAIIPDVECDGMCGKDKMTQVAIGFGSSIAACSSWWGRRFLFISLRFQLCRDGLSVNSCGNEGRSPLRNN